MSILVHNYLIRVTKPVIFSVLIVICSLLLFSQCNSSGKTAGINKISAQELHEILFDEDTIKAGQFTVIDTRLRLDFVRGHLLSAINIPMDTLEASLGDIPDKKPIVIYGYGSEESNVAANLLFNNGYSGVHVLDGGFEKWVQEELPSTIDLVQNTDPEFDLEKMFITLDELHEIVQSDNDEYAIIDVRAYHSYEEMHIKNAISIPYDPIHEFVIGVEELEFEKTKPIVVYCVGTSCDISDYAIEVLNRNGYTRVYKLAEGIEGWYSKGYPVEGL